MKNQSNILKKVIDKIKLKIKLTRMDLEWKLMGGLCFGLFPLSFYYTHTDEEIKLIIEELREFLTQFEEDE